MLWGKVLAEHRLGNAAASKAALDTLVAKYGQADAYAVAEALAWRGEREEALDWLERADARGEGNVTGETAFNPFLRPLRDHPRFKALLARMNLPTPPGASQPGK